jgi:hypothetical protein
VVPAFWWHMMLNFEDAVILKREPATLQRDLGLAPRGGGASGVVSARAARGRRAYSRVHITRLV